MSDAKTTRKPVRTRSAWLSSFALHALVSLCVAFLALPDAWIVAVAPKVDTKVRPGVREAEPEPEVVDADEVVLQEEPSETDESDPPSVDLHVTTDTIPVPAVDLKQRLKDAVANADQRSHEEQLEDLDRLTARLNAESSIETIEELANQFGEMLGTSKRSLNVAPNDCGDDFDFTSARFYDVVKHEPEEPEGRPTYVAVFIDDKGCGHEEEMPSEEGERVYMTLERVKSNRLLSAVYEKIALPIIDQMLDDLRESGVPAKKPESSEESVTHTERPADAD